MDVTAWALYAFLAGIALAGAVLHYRRHEPGGRRRMVLALLRGSVLAVLILLLFDPTLPGGPAGTGPAVVLLDGSLSMALAGPDGRTRWQEALDLAATREADRVIVFGDGPASPVQDPTGITPVGTGSRLGPALRAALESGAGRVTVVTDGAVEDAVEVAALVRSAPVEIRTVGEATAFNAGIVEVRAPRWVRAGGEAVVEITIGRLGEGGPDSLGVVVAVDGRELGRVRAETPPEGRLATTVIPVTVPEAEGGTLRLTASLVGGAGAPADDRRFAYVEVGEEPPGVALVSFRPDQEPRFLLPVLERSLGVPARGWLRLGPDRFLRVGAGEEAGRGDGADRVRTALGQADLVVLHGLPAGAPDWAVAAAREHPRMLVFPGAASVPGLGLETGAHRPGDWYVADSVPTSPVAPLLAGLGSTGAPPLVGLRVPEVPAGFWTPLLVREGRRGTARPALIAGRAGDRRVAVALGSGYWRWAFSETGGRPLYERLWAAVGGWLMEGGAGGSGPAVRPAPRLVPRGRPVDWVVGGHAAGGEGREEGSPATDSVRVRIRTWDGEMPVLDTVVSVHGPGATTPPLPPGRYRYRSRLRAAESDGELTVESYSPELTRMATLEARESTGPPGGGVESGGGRPLHASPWPYLWAVLALCAEWVLRRRWGLR